ncbi:MAG: hypothetical protein JNL05_02090 [Flavobacteriales bacterium]|nr:hypothetical protein [Flavobacteriales bacterium]
MMPRPVRTRAIAHTLLLALLLAACSDRDKHIRPDSAFIPYIPAFTAGHIPARSPILVRIAEGQTWRDSSQAALQQLFELDPSTEGTVTWHDHLTLAFTPKERLKQDRTYTVHFALGDLIEVPKELRTFTFQVTTYRQGIDVQLSDLQTIGVNDLTWQRAQVTVRTSDDATGQDLEGCFTAEQNERRLALSWEHEPNGFFHRLVADSVQRGEQASTVIFRWDGGGIDSEDKGELVFPVPAIGDLQLVNTETNSEGEQYATLLFSDPLDPAQDLSGLAGISGSEGTRLAVSGNRLTLYPAERLTGTHQAYVAAGLTNVNGRRLGKDLTVELSFEAVKPEVRLVGTGTILPSTDGLLFPFEAVNLNAVDVRIVRIYADNVAQFLQVNDLAGERELARVGRPVLKRMVPLRSTEPAVPGRWTRYHLDLGELINTEPGAIYRVSIGYRRAYSTYPCPDQENTGATLQANIDEDEEDEASWDNPYDGYYYYDDYEYYDEEYDHRRRDDPCSPSYFRGRSAVVQRNILASDLGLIAKKGTNGDLLVAVSDLRTTEPLSGVKVQVLDLQRRTIAEVVTDGEGLLTVPKSRNKPFLLVATKGTQRGYLKLDDGTALNVSEFDVSGEAVDKGLKGFLYGERGVWRPGDSLHLTFLLQDVAGRLPKDHPVVFELTDPQGRNHQRLVRTSGVDGAYAFGCVTEPTAPTGVWNARVSVGGTSFNKAIRIETVKPNRLKIAIDLGGERLMAGTGSRAVKLQANWLHGAPAKGLKAKVTVNLLRGTPEFKGYEKYIFSDLNSTVPEGEQVVFDGQLSAEGRTEFPFEVELSRHAPAVVRANIVTRVFEAGGDASVDRTEVPYLPYASYAAMLPAEPSGRWGSYFTDTTYRFALASITADGRPLAGRTLRTQVVKVNRNWWWDGDADEGTSYMSAPSTEVLSDGTVTTDAKGRATFNFRISRPAWGRFVVRVSDEESGHVSATWVYVDWPGYEGRSRRDGGKEAAVLSFNTDKQKYDVGDQCTLTIPTSGMGRAFVSIENGTRVLDARWVPVSGKETRFSFPVTAEMVPNVYAHVTLVQPHAQTANDLPMRLYGVVPVFVEDRTTHLYPEIAMANEVRTDQPFNVEVKEKNGEAMTYTLAIVDEGLLDLTRFRTPDPWKHFHAREALGVRTWDLYDQVIGAFGRQLQRVLAIGGSDEGGPADASRVNRFKPVVRHIGPFKLAAGARAKHSFTISNYVGSVRVMVVAGSDMHAYGSTEKTVPVRKPLMLLATLPRVVGPGETVDLPVNVFAMDPRVKDVTLRLDANELFTPLEGTALQLRFNAPGDRVAYFRVKVKEAVGKGRVTLVAEGAGERATETIEILVREPNLPQRSSEQAVIEAGASWNATPLPLGIAGTNAAYLELSTLPPIDLGTRLQYLIDYPHGCLEQTTSKAFPQLYLADVMEFDDRTKASMRGHVEAALRKLRNFQQASGAFSYWPGEDHVEDWCSVYAGHFTIEAERKGFALPAGMRSKWLDSQRRAARDWTPAAREYWSNEDHQALQAYRLYVMALASAPDLGAMNRLRTTPDLGLMARWTLAAAYAVTNRKDVARELVKGIANASPTYTAMGHTYGSDLRDDALIAEALLRMDDKAGAGFVIKRIAERLGDEAWYSTQSTAFGLLAVARLADGGKGTAVSFKQVIAGKAADRFSAKGLVRVDLPVPDGKRNVSIQNTGKGPLFVRLVRTGTPMTGEERSELNGIGMTVDYRTMDGKPIDPTHVEQGTDLMAVVTVRHNGAHGWYQNLALTQVFPSGWEIRNSRMEGSEEAVRTSGYSYQDIRDDRVLTYFNLAAGEQATYRVLLNASYVGRFYLPPTSCEAMYDRTVQAREKGRWVSVVRPGDTAQAP